MAKKYDTTVYDGALAVADNATAVHVCSSEPANHAAIAAASLASVAVTPGAGAGDYTTGAGDASGRKLRLLAQAGISVTATGTATHIVGTDGATLLWCTTCTSQALTSGNTVDLPAFDPVEINTPT